MTDSSRTSRALAAAAGLVLLAGCSDVGGTGDLDYVAGDGQVIEVGSEEREAPVELSGETVQGDPLDVEDLRGQVVVINMWWSGCGPCRTEMPMLVETEGEYESSADGDRIAFIGINIRDNSTANAAAFERDRGVDYPSIYDPGSETLPAFGRYAPYAPPSTLVLDVEGRVAALINGEIPSKSTLTTVVDAVLEESDGAPHGGADG